ncbi:MAG: hypothetical protein OEZ59_11395 [Deltaproteobacteria bacterium]|nr:hypothetical protein [Deltaproteobacteria bacterium]
MRFEKAIQGASNLFLFDRRSQQQLQTMAEEALPKSRDLYLIRLSQAAFAYYNAVDAQALDIKRIILQSLHMVAETRRYKDDRVYTTLSMRLEVDLLLHLSALSYQEAEPEHRGGKIFNEEDSRALSICETLLKNFPPSFDPLPSSWYSGVLPLFPPFRDELLLFYKDRVQENRIPPLATMLEKLKNELIVAAGMIMTKQFLAEHKTKPPPHHLMVRLLCAGVRKVGAYLVEAVPPMLHTASDITMPRGVSGGHLESAVKSVAKQIEQSRKEKDLRQYTGQLLQLGILHFLRGNNAEAIGTLVNTLRASSRLSPEDKKNRQYRHDEFQDIPFMIGTAYLRQLLDERPLGEAHRPLLQNCRSALMRSILLQNKNHEAFVNLVLAQHFDQDGAEIDAAIDLYLAQYGRSMSELSSVTFNNLAFLGLQEKDGKFTPDIVRWMLLARIASGGDQTKGKKILQELKTLYILNAYEFTLGYLEVYKRGFRAKDEEFIKDLENNELHSAMLFYIAHGFASLSIYQPKNSTEAQVNYDNLMQSVELNSDALYFNPRNGSALRLVETQGQIIQFALGKTNQRWDNINQMMGQRFNFFEEFLRQEKCFQELSGHLKSLGLDDKIPEFKLARNAELKMLETITQDQRERLKNRVYGK